MSKRFSLFVLLVGLVPLLWYPAGKIGFGHDMGFSLDPVGHFLDRFYTWTDRMGPFGINSVQVLPGIFIHGFEALLSVLGLSILTVQKLTYMFWFVLPGITMYALLRYLHPEKENYPIRMFGSLFYMLNHYLLQGWTIAERTKFSVVAALPLVVLFIVKVIYYRKSPIKNSLFLALVLVLLNGGEGIPLFISLLMVAAITTVSFFFFSEEAFWPKIKRTLTFLFLSIFTWTLLSSYWLFPYFRSYTQTFGQRFEDAGGTTGAVSWSQEISAHTSWTNLFRLRGIPDWYSSPGHPYANEFLNNPLLISLNLFFIVLALIGLLNLKKFKIYFLSLLLIAVPLSAGSHPPLGIFFDYFLVNVPGFALFRSSFFKFAMIIWFAYAYLIAIGLKQILDLLKSDFKKLTVLIICVIGLIVYNYPFFNGIFFNYAKDRSTMVSVPDYIFKAQKEIDNNKFSARTLLVPNPDLRTQYIEYDWGYFGVDVLTHLLSRKSHATAGVFANPDDKALINGVLSEYIKFGKSNLVRFMSVDRAILQNDFISPDYDGNAMRDIKKRFKESSDFTLTKSIGKWDFYNYKKNSLPQIYSPSKIVLIASSNETLDLVGNLLGEFDEGAFIRTPSAFEDKEIDFDKFIVQAKCADCPPVENYQIFFSVSKTLIPGTRFYQLGKLITNFKKRFTSNPITRLETNLSIATTLISDLGAFQYKSEEKPIKIITEDLTQTLKEMRSDLNQVYLSEEKLKILKKIRFHLSLFVSYESQWVASAQSTRIKSGLSQLETELKEFINYIEASIGEKKLEEDPRIYKYSLDVPREGVYDFYIYKQSLDSVPTLKINDQTHTGQLDTPNWYRFTNLPLRVQSISIEIPKSQEIKERPTIFAVLDSEVESNVPKIEFIALNQTKYLVRFKTSNRLILNFNSRFDKNWNLREVDYHTASGYFSGNTRDFLNGKVIEYERRDDHVITDIIFPFKNQSLQPSLELNGFSNGWVIDSQERSGGMKTYLLEYNLQNEYYKSAVLSIISFVLVLFCLYLNRNDN